jgi:hypothetical protein
MQNINDVLDAIESTLYREFPNAKFEYARQSYTNHVELWIYILNLSDYQAVQKRCDDLEIELKLESFDPKIWLLVKTWTGPWPGGETENQIRELRRIDFRKRHSIDRLTHSNKE